MRLLVVEDYTPLREALVAYLREAGHAVDAASDGEEGWWHVQGTSYDAIVLDRQLPRLGGDEILRRLRRSGRGDPVLVLTARGEIPDRIDALDAGADDYVVKPASLPELEARIKALVRRAAGQAAPLVRVGRLEIDTSRRLASFGGRRIDLTAKEWMILELLARKAGTVVTRDAMWEGCYDFNEEPNPNRIEVHLANLRRKLADAGADGLIQTRRGQGYILGDGT